jgi:hypothetical protein
MTCAQRRPILTSSLSRFFFSVYLRNFPLPASDYPGRSSHSSLSTTHYPLPTLQLSPLFIALPYVFLCKSFVYRFYIFRPGGWGHSACSDLRTCRSSDLSTLFFSGACRLLPLSLPPNALSFTLFSAVYRHFFADQGGGPNMSITSTHASALSSPPASAPSVSSVVHSRFF